MKYILAIGAISFTLSCGPVNYGGLTPGALGEASMHPEVIACQQMDAESCEAFKATNEARIENGVPAMIYCPVCFAMAQEQSDDISARGYFSHDRPAFPDRPAESFSARAARFGLSGVGENIAGGGTGRGAVQMWMNSPGHRANILNPGYKSFAVGTRNGISTQVFSM